MYQDMSWRHVVGFIALFYVLLHTSRRNAVFIAHLPHQNHTEVFEYLSTIENFKLLNPTITSIQETKRSDDTFRTTYTEILSQLPFVTNSATAEYATGRTLDGGLELLSTHLTCFIDGLFCVSTDSSLQVRQSSRHKVQYREEIWYKCPWSLSAFCLQEVLAQRRHILATLHRVFTTSQQQSDVKT